MSPLSSTNAAATAVPWLVLDNGSYACKFAHVVPGDSSSSATIATAPNVVGKVRPETRRYFGSELQTHCRDHAGLVLTSPFDKGYLTFWQLQVELWERLFVQASHGKIDTTATNLLLTEPLFNPPNIQSTYDQVVFEYFDFPQCVRTSAPTLAVQGSVSIKMGVPAWTHACHIIVDAGHAFTHVVPYVQGKPVLRHARRIDVGGALLTEQLAQLVSYRQWNMVDEPYIINQVKEACCYFSTDFETELLQMRNGRTLLQRFVLPDYSRGVAGHVKPRGEPKIDGETLLVMNNERITVSELLFRPSDMVREKKPRSKQAGIAETITHCIRAVAEDAEFCRGDPDVSATLVELFYGSVRVVGGSARIPGLKARLENELRASAPIEATVNVTIAEDPVTAAAESGQRMVAESSPYLVEHVVSRAEWLEHGERITATRFSF